MKQEKLHLYTDGGCRGNPSPIGAFAFVILNDNKELLFQYSEENKEDFTTNNIMEMRAVIEGLKKIKKD